MRQVDNPETSDARGPPPRPRARRGPHPLGQRHGPSQLRLPRVLTERGLARACPDGPGHARARRCVSKASSPSPSQSVCARGSCASPAGSPARPDARRFTCPAGRVPRRSSTPASACGRCPGRPERGSGGTNDERVQARHRPGRDPAHRRAIWLSEHSSRA